MTVSHYKACLGIACDFSAISIDTASLFNSVCYVLSTGLLWKVIPCMFPLIVSTQCNLRVCDIDTVCHKLNFYACSSLAILVIRIIPLLEYWDACLSWCITVGNVISIDISIVILNRILSDGVLYLITTSVLWKICKFVLPALCCSYTLWVNLTAISIESDCDSIFSLTILIIIVIPSLGSLNVNCLRCMGVFDGKTALYTAGYLSIIASYLCLWYSVCDRIACRIILRKILKAVCPISCCIRCNRFPVNFRITILNNNSYVIRSQTILIVIIIPYLGSAYIDVCSIGIGNGHKRCSIWRYLYSGICIIFWSTYSICNCVLISVKCSIHLCYCICSIWSILYNVASSGELIICNWCWSIISIWTCDCECDLSLLCICELCIIKIPTKQLGDLYLSNIQCVGKLCSRNHSILIFCEFKLSCIAIHIILDNCVVNQIASAILLVKICKCSAPIVCIV